MGLTLKEESPTRFDLVESIFIYRGKEESGYGTHHVTTLAMHHRMIPTVDGSLRPGEGTPVTRSLINHLLDEADTAPLTYVPANVLALGRNSLAWHVPPQKRAMFFNTQGQDATQAFDGVPVPHPGLVFVARNRQLHVFATASETRPILTTPLSAAPYWNVYKNGSVCVGSTPLPDTFAPKDVDSWTEAFFASNFTHMNTGKHWSYPGTYAEMLTEAVKIGKFDPNWLGEPYTTLEKAVCGN